MRGCWPRCRTRRRRGRRWAAAAANGDGERYANARRLAAERESAVRKAVGVLERLGYDVR